MKKLILSLILLLFFTSYTVEYKAESKKSPNIYYLEDNLTQDALYHALIQCDIKHPDIVFAQAILETGYFKSRVCLEYNNLFGLYNSYTGDYYKFNHWTESIKAYKKYIEYKYHPEYSSYYNFLDELGYAEDPEYIYKVKTIVNRHKKENDKRRRNKKSYKFIQKIC